MKVVQSATITSATAFFSTIAGVALFVTFGGSRVVIEGEPIGEGLLGAVVVTSLVINSVVALLLSGFIVLTLLAKDSVASAAKTMSVGYLVGSCVGSSVTALVLLTPWREVVTLWAPALLSGPLGLIAAAFVSRLARQRRGEGP